MATAEQTVHVSEFTNELFIDFSRPENRSHMEDALKKVKAEFGREYPMWLNGQKVTTTEKRTSTNPYARRKSLAFFKTPRRRWPGRRSKTLTNTLRHGRESPPRSAPSVSSARRRSCASESS